MITKIFAILILVWFYKSAGKVGENKIQWAVIGVLGYAIFVGLSYILIAKPLLALFLNQTMWLSMVLGHLPAILGLIAAVFIRLRLLSLAK